MLGQRPRWWASIGRAMGQRLMFAGWCWQAILCFAPKCDNKFCLIGLHSLYCPQEPFNNINYKSHWHLGYQPLYYGYAARGETSSDSCLQETVTLLVVFCDANLYYNGKRVFKLYQSLDEPPYHIAIYRHPLYLTKALRFRDGCNDNNKILGFFLLCLPSVHRRGDI